jgi:hypothetical protein
VFKNVFVQANVLGPLIGFSEATALRDRTRRWMWWFAANRTTYLLGAAAYDFGKWLLGVFSISRQISPRVPAARIPDRRGVDAVGDRARGNRRGPPAHRKAEDEPPTQAPQASRRDRAR